MHRRKCFYWLQEINTDHAFGNQLSAESRLNSLGTWNYGIQSHDWDCFGQGRAWALHIPLALTLSAAPSVALQLPALSHTKQNFPCSKMIYRNNTLINFSLFFPLSLSIYRGVAIPSLLLQLSVLWISLFLICEFITNIKISLVTLDVLSCGTALWLYRYYTGYETAPRKLIAIYCERKGLT